MSPLTEPRRTSATTPILNGIDSLRQFLIPIVVVIAFNQGDSSRTVLTAVFATVFAGGYAAVGWLRLRWWIEEDRLRVRSGLFQIDDRTIPVERIQRIDRNQNLLARFFGVYELNAETAGGSGSELTLRYLAQDEVDALESWLASRRSSLGDTEDGETIQSEDEVLMKVRPWELVVAGATSNRLGALALIIASAFQVFDDATTDTAEQIERLIPSLADRLSSGRGAAIAVALLITAALIVGWIASIATTLLRYWEFELVEADGDLRRTHGLISRFQASSPRHRIQTVRIEQPLLRRLVSRATVIAETAGSPGGEAGGSGVLTPIAEIGAARDLTAIVIDQSSRELTDLEPVSRLTIRRAFFRTTLLLAIPGAPIAWLTEQWAAAVVIVIAAALAYSRARFAALGYRTGRDHVVTRSGVLSRRTWTVPLAKVQTVAIRRSPFQRRLGLATVYVDTAGGRSRIPIIDLPDQTARSVSDLLARRSTEAHNPDAV